MRAGHLRRVVFVAILTPFTVLWLPRAATAQFDHLTCFKVADSRKFEALVGLDMIQDQFDAVGTCKVIGKAKLFCVPTEGTVAEFTVQEQPAALEQCNDVDDDCDLLTDEDTSGGPVTQVFPGLARPVPSCAC